MSTHPNAILLLALTPNDLSRKTYRAILAENGGNENGGNEVSIEGESYHIDVMENDYDKSMQIAAKEGDIVVYSMVTYGYGEIIAWETLVAQKVRLQEWAIGICERHNCSYQIFVTANYW